MLVWITALLFIIVGLAIFIGRVRLAEMHAITLGGTVTPGCIVLEAVVMIVLAIILIAAHLAGLF